jgi:hypothetical protein
MGALASDLPVGRLVNTAVTLNENEWRDRRTLEFIAEAVRPAEALGLEPGALGEAASRNAERVRRGPAAAGTPVAAVTLPDVLEAGRAAAAAGHALWLTALPDDATSALRQALAGTAPLHLDLEEAALGALEAAALAHPGVHDLRRGFVALQRGLPLPFEPLKNERVRRALEQLELLDGMGRARSGQRRDPYDSDALLDGLMTRHLLLRLVTAYRHLDDVAFAVTVATLFGEGDPSSGRPGAALAASSASL